MAAPINVTANVKTTAIKAVVRVVGPKGDKGEQGDPATNLVTSVNGKQGTVVLDHTDVGADVAGAAVEALVDAQAYTDDAIDALTKADIGLSDVPNLDTTAAVANEHTHANKAVLDNTTASFTTAEKSKLSGIAPGATQNATDAELRDRATHTGSQAISTVTGLQTALDAKASDASLTAHTTDTNNPHAVTKAQVGLGSVDNTSDVDKPVSTATQTALDGKLDKATPGMFSLYSVSSSGTNGTMPYSSSVNASTIALRTATSQLKVNTAVNNDEAVNKAQMDAADAALLPLSGSRVMTGELQSGFASGNAFRQNRPLVRDISWGVNSTGNFNVYNQGGAIPMLDVASDGTGISLGNWTVNPRILRGTGFPNGVLSAPVGSKYVDTAVTNGASEWIKASGTGNTGWVVTVGDTGWRNITALAPSGNVVSGALYIRRKNDTVLLRMSNLVLVGANTVMIDNFRSLVGTGFEPGENMNAVIRVNTSGVVTTSVLVQPASTTQGMVRYDNGAAMYSVATWACITDWPTTLP